MAVNLRLSEDLADGLRALSAETGRSQQDLAREAIADLLRCYRLRSYPPEVRHLVTPAEQPYTPLPAHLKIRLPEGVTLQNILDDMRQ
ncbi:MAG: ribbon-helix-helix protein, CopG family [Actinomycetota bacterium]|nr:ribbon-helix-helix protein, CopG family [Actinomycetota bacterium]